MSKNQKTILRADIIGFCLGVRQAVGTLEKALEYNDRDVYTLGPIIHNPRVVGDFTARGVKSADDPGDLPPDCRVIIRAHGVPPRIKSALDDGTRIIMDGTCPKVIASQKTVRKYAQMGFHTVIVGDPDHGEIKGLAGFTEHPIIISGPEEAAKLDLRGPVMVISQTTIKQDEYDRVCDVLKQKCKDLKIIESICSATEKRQEALRELCSRVDACLVIGGRESANTQRLYLTALETGVPSWHIQDASEIPDEIGSYDVIGLSAGASTPDSLIAEVERRLQSM